MEWPETDGREAGGFFGVFVLTEAIVERSAKSERLAGFIRTLEAQKKPVAEFDERLWGAMVDYVTVGVDKRLTVMFRDGTGILA